MAKVPLHDGMRVKIIAIPDDEPEYEGDLGTFATVEGEPWESEGEEWCYATPDGGVGGEYKVSELEALNIIVLEGVAEWLWAENAHVPYRIGDRIFGEHIFEGKRYRMTIEELDTDEN